jgi:hypothetical protein
VGYGKDLIRTKDYKSWREELAGSLSLNISKQFSRKQPALAQRILDSSFPDITILKYYSAQKVQGFIPGWRKRDIVTVAELCKPLKP